MLEIAKPLKETLEKSTFIDLQNWFSQHPTDAAWYVISDYCFGDKTKNNDTASFSILLNHDKISNIKEYINAFAPKDIKSTRNVTQGFLQYINSPVIFNITFLIDRDTKLLKSYLSSDYMKEFLTVYKEFIKIIDSNSYFDDGFVESVFKRIVAFENDFMNKNFNAKLSRQIFLVATFASLVFHYLVKLKKPSHIQWVSDRDAMVERYDGFIYELSYFMFLNEFSNSLTHKGETKIILIDKPKFIFPTPDKSGNNHYDELIRIPDYLAGTLADYNMKSSEFSKNKFYTIFYDSLVNSKNHAVIQVYGNSEKLSSRRLIHKNT